MNIKESIKSFIDVASPKSLRNWIEELLYQNEQKDQIIEQQKAQIRRLQGLPAKPVFNSKDKTSELDNESDDDDDDTPEDKMKKRRKAAAQKPRRKKKDFKIDQTKKIPVSKNDLDSSYVSKGSRKVIIQDILFNRNNIEFELERFYSSIHKKTIDADLPNGFNNGYFGANLIAFIKTSYYEGDVTIKKIFKMLKAIDVHISIKQINRIINDQPDELVKELEDARITAIKKVDYQQIDDTGATILAHSSAYTTVTCNPFFTFLTTSVSKNRRNAIMALSQAKEALYKINQQTIIVAFTSLKSLKIQHVLEKYQSEKLYTEEELKKFLDQDDFKNLKFKVREEIKTAMLVGAFYDGELGITGGALVSDDAGQFNNLYDDHILCWYHELRHYKDLFPVLKENQIKLRLFFDEAKRGYKIFKKWCQTRDNDLRDYIFKWFNEFFQKKTGYRLLDIRKEKSFKKMAKLLAPLRTTVRVPLTNNESERDIRGRTIKRKISLFDRTWTGVQARDFYISLKQTCRKNGVSFHQFLLDRESRALQIPQLADIIKQASPQY